MSARTLGHYEIGEKLGAGGMGEVYRAFDTRLGRSVALKILTPETARSPQMRARFEREAKAVAALQHPNILTLYSVEEAGDTLFLTMELIEGRDLPDAIPAGGFPLAGFLDLAISLADAVSSAHSKGITHRDLKPRNIMLSQSGQIKVLDFGLAKLCEPEGRVLLSDDTISMSATADGVLIGTIAYMAPEQARGLPADHRSDIFSLGIILYEMLTRRHPFSSETSADMISAILRDRPRLASDVRPDVPRRLAQLIDRCLEKDPKVRLQSALALRNDLEEIKRHIGAGKEEKSSSIAVLPPVEESAGEDQAHFAEGLADELARNLLKIRALRVASRTSALLCRRATSDAREIGRMLDVEAVLHGTIRREGERLTLLVELTEVSSGRRLWAERYDRRSEDVFAIQDGIASEVARALGMTPTAGERRSMSAQSTSDIEAYDYYLRGRRFFYQYRRKGIELALQMFERATRHDPGYALAYAGMADCYCFLFLYAERSQASLEGADRASAKALELDADLAEAHASRGQVLSLVGRHAEAEAEFETAARLGPKLFEAHYLYARDCFARGQMEKAAHLYELASSVRPEDYQSALLVGQVYDRLDRPVDAHAARTRGVAIVEERLKLYPDDVRALYMGANGLIALGRRDRALEWAALAMEMEPGEPMVLYNVACVFSMAGEVEPAIDYLERAVHSGLRQLGWFQNDPDLDPLRGHPRFADLMKEMQ